MATSVDFDYSGPPVNVSNGMAVQLVSQFGVRNAWFAFLKLRGMKMSNEEAEKAQLAFAYFRNKIGHLRRQASELGAGKVKEGEEKAEEGDEVDTLLAEEFDNFLANPDSLELRPDAPTYPDVEERDLTPESDSASTAGVPSTPTTASLLAVIEQSKKRQKLTQKQQQSKNSSSKNVPGNELEKESDSMKEMITTTGSQQNTKEVAASSGGGTNDGNSSNGGGGGGKSTTTTAKNSRDRPDDPETKQVVEKLLAAKEEIARRHAETIDDVVSLVMEKIRNNQPFEGELSVNAGTNTGPPKSHHRRVGAGPAGQRAQRAGGTTAQHQQRRGEELGQESGSNRNFALFQGQPSSSQSGGAQQAIVGQPTATTIMGQQPAQTAFGQLPPGQSIVLLHNSATGGTVQFPSYSVAGPPQPAGKMHAHHQQLNTHGHNLLMPTDQVTILSGGHFPDMIRSSAGGPTTITSAAGAGLITTSGQQQQKQPHHPRHKGTAQQQYQQQQQIIGQVLDTTATGDTAPAAAIPIEVAIQQNMTVQELIQTLKAQSRHQNAHIILHHNANPPTASGAPISASYQQQMFQAQQETPDSSQEAASINEARKLAVEQEQKGTASKKGRKRKAPAADEKQTGGQPAAKQKQQQTQMVAAAAAAAPAAMGGFMKNGATSLGTAPNKGVETQQQQQPMTASLEKSKPAPKGKKAPAPKQEQQQQPPTISTSVPSTVVKAETAASSSKQQQGIEDLESQLRKANKLLVAERNKSNTQKKRAEKLQTELDKALDSIQLLQIDLACQKTDNNNLIAENIALKAENQQLRTKGISAAHRVVTSPTASTSTSVAATGRGRKKKEEAMVVEMQEKETEPKAAKSGRGRKPVVASASAHSMEMEPSSIRLPERTLTPPPLSSELGRRQSKRICVSRNQFMKNLF